MRPDRRLFTGSGAWSPVPALYADLPFMYLFELVADDLGRDGHVFKGEVGGGAHFPAGIRVVAWPGAAGCWYEWLRRAKRQGRPPCGGVRQGLRHPGEEFDGLVADSWVMSVVQTTALDPNGGMSAGARRSGAAGGASGAGV